MSKKPINVAKYDDVVKALCADNGALVNALIMSTTVATQSDLLDSLLFVLEMKGKSVDVIKTLITMEVAVTLEASTLFRGNSSPTKLMTAYSKLIGTDYLNNTLRTLLVLLLCSQEGFEVNPAKASTGDNIEENLSNLMDWCERFVEQIVQTADAIPTPFRLICKHLQSEVTPKFPKSRYITVGGFIFLRFICPAILAPLPNGLVDGQPTSSQQRRLTLVAKALQNLSNGVQFGAKEAYLTAMNDFIEDYQEMLYEFFDEISVPTEADNRAAKAKVEENYPAALEMLHSFLIVDKTKDDVAKELKKSSEEEALAFVAMVDALGPV